MMQSEINFPDKNTGYICSCCGQFVKVYHRRLNSSMAMVLILIYRSGKLDYFHVENWLKSIGKSNLRADFHKLRYWGLLKKKIEDRKDGSDRNGFYRITPSGIMFVEVKITVPEKALIFNNKLQGFEGDEINIYQALGNNFDYNKLMNND